MDLKKFEEIQLKLAKKVSLQSAVKLENIKRIAGFDVAFSNSKCVAAAAVFDVAKKEIVEKKYYIGQVKIPYVPGFLAFREGDPIIQVYFMLEYEPNVLLVDGHGIAHPRKCGLATYVGIQTNKPTIGIAKELFVGEERDGKIFVDSEQRGIVLSFDEKALFASPGHMVAIEDIEAIVKLCILPGSTSPEPLKQAHRFAKHILEKILLKEEAAGT